MWLTVAKIVLIAFLVAGIATLVIVYALRRRRGIEGWSPIPGLYSDLMGYDPKLPPPEWVDWQEDDDGPSGIDRPKRV